jgi:hypothetical protein
VEVPGVIGVSADGNLSLKSFYSSYGVGSGAERRRALHMASGADQQLRPQGL